MKETVLDCDFLILNRLPHIYSARRFQAEINRLNLDAKLISPEMLFDRSSQIKSCGLGPAVLYRQGDFNFWTTHHSLSKLPLKIVNSPEAFLKARDKWVTVRAWQAIDIPMPQTIQVSSVLSEPFSQTPLAKVIKTIHSFLTAKFGLPYVLKKRISSQGRQVFLIEHLPALTTVLCEDAINFQRANELEVNYFKNEYPFDISQVQPPMLWIQLNRWLAQQYIHESAGQDTRVFLVQNEIHAIERKNRTSFRSNLHQGGVAIPTQLTLAEKALVKKIHQLSCLSYSGVDFLRTNQGPLFLEINPSPGFEGIESVYPATNIAASLLKLLG